MLTRSNDTFSIAVAFPRSRRKSYIEYLQGQRERDAAQRWVVLAFRIVYYKCPVQKSTISRLSI